VDRTGFIQRLAAAVIFVVTAIVLYFVFVYKPF